MKECVIRLFNTLVASLWSLDYYTENIVEAIKSHCMKISQQAKELGFRGSELTLYASIVNDCKPTKDKTIQRNNETLAREQNVCVKTIEKWMRNLKKKCLIQTQNENRHRKIIAIKLIKDVVSEDINDYPEVDNEAEVEVIEKAPKNKKSIAEFIEVLQNNREDAIFSFSMMYQEVLQKINIENEKLGLKTYDCNSIDITEDVIRYIDYQDDKGWKVKNLKSSLRNWIKSPYNAIHNKQNSKTKYKSTIEDSEPINMTDAFENVKRDHEEAKRKNREKLAKNSNNENICQTN